MILLLLSYYVRKNKLERLTFLFIICNGCILREDKSYRVMLVEYESQVSEGRFQVLEWACYEIILAYDIVTLIERKMLMRLW